MHPVLLNPSQRHQTHCLPITQLPYRHLLKLMPIKVDILVHRKFYA